MICTSYDQYLQEKDETVLVIELIDGTIIYTDDGRYGEKDASWDRINEYLTKNRLKILRISIKFRSHQELVASRTKDTIGWYFIRQAGAYCGQPTELYMIVGKVGLEEGKDVPTIKCSKWKVPEAYNEGDEVRSIEGQGRFIIWE